MSPKFRKQLLYILGLITTVNLGTYLFNLIQKPEEKLYFIIVSIVFTLIISIVGIIVILKKNTHPEG